MENQQVKKFSFLDQFRIIKTLGSGYQAIVKLAIDQNGNYVAIKKYKTQNTNMKALIDELSILKNLNQENIVKLIAVRQNATYKKKDQTSYNCFAIILQYCGGGELFDFICETGRFSQKVTRTYFHQMMSGIHYLHEKGYAHRDIKPQNLLLSNDFKLKIADFGFSCMLKGHDGSGVLRTKLGTQGYMAPQIVIKNYEGKSVDIFATGVILFIMYAGNPPFQRTNEGDPYYKLIIHKDFDKFWKYHQRRRKPGFFSDSFKSLFVHMVAADPKDRPNIVQIASHPWVKQALVSHNDITKQFTQRKKQLDIILQQRSKQQEKNKQLHLQAISNQTNPDRSNSQADEHFIQIYNQQLLLKRNIDKGQIFSKDGFVIEENITFAVSELLHRLRDIRIEIYSDEDNQQLQGSETEGAFISFNKLVDSKASQIQVQYKYNYGLDDFQEQFVGIKFLLSQDNSSNLIVNMERQTGNMFYFKKITTQIKNRFKSKI